MQTKVGIETKEIGGAYGIVGTRNRLIFVVKVGKRKALGFGHDLHVFKAVLGIIFGIIGRDCDDADAQFLKVAGIPDNPVKNGKDVWAVVADEHHKRAVDAFNVANRDGACVCRGQSEIRGFPAKIADGWNGHDVLIKVGLFGVEDKKRFAVDGVGVDQGFCCFRGQPVFKRLSGGGIHMCIWILVNFIRIQTYGTPKCSCSVC